MMIVVYSRPMERDSFKSVQSELGLQIVPVDEGIEVVFTASDGTFSDLSAVEKRYEDEIKSETRELRKLQALMTAAAFLQVYQIAEGVRDENPEVILPIAIIAILMVYVRNKSMVPTKEKRDISRLKLSLVQEYEGNSELENY